MGVAGCWASMPGPLGGPAGLVEQTILLKVTRGEAPLACLGSQHPPASAIPTFLLPHPLPPPSPQRSEDATSGINDLFSLFLSTERKSNEVALSALLKAFPLGVLKA